MAFGRGKVILLGEHAVVHGRPALAVGLARGVTATARRAGADVLRVEPWGVSVGPDPHAEEPLGRAFHAVLAAAPDAPRPVEVSAQVDLPPGGGLGCSAALGIAVVASLDELTCVDRPPEDVAEHALAWERVFHGNPSGIDTAISARGGVLLFRRGEPVEPVRARPFTLVVGHSGEASSTRAMVERVARQHARARDRVEETFDAIAAIVQNGKLAAAAGDLRALGQLMDLNQALLSSLMVSTARLEELCAAARDAGALGAKLTGAGGGGCMIALAGSAEDAEAVREALAAMDADPFVAEAGT